MILVMLSGGLDSTGALYKLLTETSEPIHAHHLDIQNLENRWIPERYAVSKVLEFCKKIRDFKFTSSTYEFLQFRKHFTWDNDIVRFVAAQISKDNAEITQVALGKCADDNDSPDFRLRAVQSQAIWNACFIESKRPAPEIIRPVETLNKAQIWEMLPDEIRQHIWACRTPIFQNRTYSYCFKCQTCQVMAKHGILNSKPQNPAS